MSWPMKTIGDVCEVIPGFAFKSKDLVDVGTPVIKIGNITENRSVDVESAHCLPENLIENRHKKYFLQNGDILIAMTGATAGKIGRIRCAEDQVMLLNQRVAKLRPVLIIPDFFWAAISTNRYRTIFFGLGGGAAQPNMSGSQIESVEMPYPPIAQQERIASILSAYDDLIENNRRRIRLLEQAAQLLYKEWFVHLRFPGHEHTKIIDGVPEGWDRLNLEEIATISKGKNITKEVSREGDVPVVAGGLHPAYYHDEANTSGPVITISASGANAGYVALYHGDIWASDCSYLSSSDNPEIWFLYLSLRSRQAEITGMQQGAAQPHVYPRHLKRLSLLIPPEKLRKVFHDIVDANFLQMANLEKQIVKLAKARDLLLPKLMNGEVAV